MMMSTVFLYTGEEDNAAAQTLPPTGAMSALFVLENVRSSCLRKQAEYYYSGVKRRDTLRFITAIWKAKYLFANAWATAS